MGPAAQRAAVLAGEIRIHSWILDGAQ
jgi:hypothetical protein